MGSMGETSYRWRRIRQRAYPALLGIAVVCMLLALTGIHVFYVAAIVALALFFAGMLLASRYAD